MDLLDLDPRGGGVASPRLLDRVERSFHLELTRAPVLDAVEECRIEARRYGPVLAAVVAALPEEGRFNRLLGAAADEAASGGHLEQALDWVESLDVEAQVPVTAGRAETPATEALLERRGYSPGESRVRFVRPAAPPDFPEPPGIAVVEIEEFVEGFADLPGEALGLDLIAQSFLEPLPRREGWRCYLAYDPDGYLVASASMFRHAEVATLAFAGTAEDFRGQGAHLALLRRRIADACGPVCHTLCAEVELSPEERRDDPHPAIRNLVRAGFKQAAVRAVWRR
jgi:Acetyltransferase (GNAT) domain